LVKICKIGKIAKLGIKTMVIKYTEKEHKTWHDLYQKQINSLRELAYPNFFSYIDEIGLSHNIVPQISDISTKLYQKTKWCLVPVSGILPTKEFYSLLAEKCFPSTTFLRSAGDEFDTRPDIFHEMFGHAVMLVDEGYAHFLERVARFAISCSDLEQKILQRLLWYTIEVGLIKISGQLKIYGGALLSSYGEGSYAIKSTSPIREQFNLCKISRTPFRIDIFNEYYYYIEDFKQLKDLNISREVLRNCMESIIMLNERPVLFESRINDGYSSTRFFPC
jgi:phenylalanine-4-hydroxylase